MPEIKTEVVFILVFLSTMISINFLVSYVIGDAYWFAYQTDWGTGDRGLFVMGVFVIIAVSSIVASITVMLLDE